MRSSMLAVLAAVSLSACGTMTLPEENSIKPARMEAVLVNIKQQVRAYQQAALYSSRHPESDPNLARVRKNGFRCGDGSIEFAITTVTMTLGTTVTRDQSGKVGLKVPGPAATIGLGGGINRSAVDKQELTIPLYPVPLKDIAIQTKPATRHYPIAEALMGLRGAMVYAAGQEGACMYTFNKADPSKDPGGTYTIGLSITDQGNGSVDVGVGPVTVNAEGKTISLTGNSLVVSFRQVVGKTTASGKLIGVMSYPGAAIQVEQGILNVQ